MTSSDSVVSRFDIELEAGETPIFKGGEVIRGRLVIELRRPIVINAVKLQLKGRAAMTNDAKKQQEVEKIYFDTDFVLLERPPGKPEAGHFTWIGDFTYNLPFECPLPKGCPASYEGPYAFVRYFIRASLVQEESDSSLHEYYVKKAFSLVPPSDGYLVNGEEKTAQDSAMFGKCCCKGKLTAELNLPKTGYLPGEEVYGDLKVGGKQPQEILEHVEVRLVDRVRRIGVDTSPSPWRTLIYTPIQPDAAPVKGKQAIERRHIPLLTIPPVCPSTKGDVDPISDVHSTPMGRLMESPSSATLRFRKQPFLGIEYAIQLSLGRELLLEVPIDIGEHSSRDQTVSFHPFVAGAQPIEEVRKLFNQQQKVQAAREEHQIYVLARKLGYTVVRVLVQADEVGKVAINGPFMYTPNYSYRQTVPMKQEKNNVNDVAKKHISTIMEESVVDSLPLIVNDNEIEEISTTDMEKAVISKTKTTVTHHDEHGTKTMEETVIESEGTITRRVEETLLTDEGLEKHTLEETTTDDQGNEKTVAFDVVEHEESGDELETEREMENRIQKAKERIDQIEDSIAHNAGDGLNVDAHAEDNGDMSVTATETHEEGHSKTLKTTTITHHPDGSESLVIQEQTCFDSEEKH